MKHTNDNNDDKEIQALLQKAFPAVEAEMRRDLWPEMLRRIGTSEVVLPWYDWALIAGVVAAMIIFPKFILFFAYQL